MEIGNKKRKKEFVEELKSLNTSSNSSILSGGSPYSKKIADEKSVIKGGDESMNEQKEQNSYYFNLQYAAIWFKNIRKYIIL